MTICERMNEILKVHKAHINKAKRTINRHKALTVDEMTELKKAVNAWYDELIDEEGELLYSSLMEHDYDIPYKSIDDCYDKYEEILAYLDDYEKIGIAVEKIANKISDLIDNIHEKDFY